MTTDGSGSALGEVRGTLRQALADLAGVERHTGSTPAERSCSAELLERLTGELAQAAAMIRALPGPPAQAAGHTHAAIAAFRTAARHEPDLAAWLATILSTLAREETASAASQPSSWAAWLLRQLIHGQQLKITVAPDCQHPEPASGARHTADLTDHRPP